MLCFPGGLFIVCPEISPAQYLAIDKTMSASLVPRRCIWPPRPRKLSDSQSPVPSSLRPNVIGDQCLDAVD